YAQTLVMAAAVFPAYLLARTVVSPRWALFAAVGAIAAPALSYAPILVEEPFAYPASTLALWLCVRAAAQPSRRTFLLALAGCVLATAVRSQLIALFAALFVPFLVLGWRTERMRRFRSTWSGWDWAGAVALAVGAVLLVMAVLGHVSTEWADVMAQWKGRIVQYGVWAFGALAIGVGVLPVIAALAALVRPREELREARTLAFVLVTGSALFTVVFYGGLKGAYVSTKLGSYVVERNLIYLAPLAFAATALLLERRTVKWWAVLAATGAVLWCVTDVPKQLNYPYYEAHGLSILAFANRILRWPEGRIEDALVVLVILAGGLLLAVGLTRARSRLSLALCAGIAVAVLGWNLLNEIYAANGERIQSAQFARTFIHPPNWVDQRNGGGSTTLLGQQFGNNHNPIHLLEFFNRSVRNVWSADPNSPAPAPGLTVTPDLARPDGTLTPDPGTDYALAVNGVQLQSEVAAQLPEAGLTLYRLAGPLQLAANQTGVAGDGWMGERAAYNRYSGASDPKGFGWVTLSRVGFCPVGEDGTVLPLPSIISIRIGPLGIGPDRQPALESVTDSARIKLPGCKDQTVYLRPPRGPWRMEVDAQTFVPSEIDPRQGDNRQLGAQATFGFLPE
ncbi:MAG TPA: hypothetical protein VH572_06350, partial [Gaiella sp.]